MPVYKALQNVHLLRYFFSYETPRLFYPTLSVIVYIPSLRFFTSRSLCINSEWDSESFIFFTVWKGLGDMAPLCL